jgi:uncharacterized membrane protein YbaN (DUF454 family)
MEDHASKNNTMKHSSKHVRILLVLIGTVSLILGLIGIILPLLPTTPFLLISAACYARSSDRFYNGLLNNRIFGPPIREWRDHRSVTKRTKITSVIIIIISFSITIIFVLKNPTVQIILTVVAIGFVVLLTLLPTRKKNSTQASPNRG